MFTKLGKNNEIFGVCSWVFLDIWGAERSPRVGMLGAPTHFGVGNPGKYHEILGSVRWRSRISLCVRLQEKDSVTVQVYKSRKNTWVFFVGAPGYPGCQKKKKKKKKRSWFAGGCSVANCPVVLGYKIFIAYSGMLHFLSRSRHLAQQPDISNKATLKRGLEVSINSSDESFSPSPRDLQNLSRIFLAVENDSYATNNG